MHRFCALPRGAVGARLELERDGEARPGVAPKLHRNWGRLDRLNPASCKVFWSFPQAIAFVWKVDALNVRKIQDIVVCC